MPERIEVRMTRKHGRGVFANCRIRKGEVIEVAPVIVFSRKESKIIEKISLVNHCYSWGNGDKQTALVLGCGCFYNHSYQPNADLSQLQKKKALVFRALRDILPGEEITFNYNGSPDDQSPIRFNKNSWRFM